MFFKEYGTVPLLYWITCLKSPSARRLIFEHMELWISYKSRVTGQTLQQMGLKGKKIGEALTALKLAAIDGEIHSLDDEVKYIKTHILNS